MENFLKS